MSQTKGSSHRADEIFRTGPETLVAQAQTVVSGTIVNYSKQILSKSQPEAEGFPLTWVVNGDLAQLQTLKGTPMSGQLKFTRPEQSVMLPKDAASLYWEDEYGESQPDGQAVVFMGTGDQILKVIPSGGGEQNFISLVRDIVQIQGVKQSDGQIQQWLKYLNTASTDEGRKAALRSLVNASVEWAKLAPEVSNLLSSSKNSTGIRLFGFGIIAFGIMEEKWGLNGPLAVHFLCQVFSAEQDARLAIQQIQHVKLVLRYSDDESFRERRKPIRQQILGCIKQRKDSGRHDPQLDEQIRQMLAAYPER